MIGTGLRRCYPPENADLQRRIARRRRGRVAVLARLPAHRNELLDAQRHDVGTRAGNGRRGGIPHQRRAGAGAARARARAPGVPARAAARGGLGAGVRRQARHARRARARRRSPRRSSASTHPERSCPRTTPMPTVAELTEPYGNFMLGPVRGPGVCEVCLTFTDGYPRCYTCARTPRALDVLAPISYSVAAGQLHHVLAAYKRSGRPGRAPAVDPACGGPVALSVRPRAVPRAGGRRCRPSTSSQPCRPATASATRAIRCTGS